MTHWDDPASGSWDDAHGEEDLRREEPPAPRLPARHSADEPDPFNGFAPSGSARGPGHTDPWGIPAQPTRPVSPAASFAPPPQPPQPPPAPPQRPVSPARSPVSPARSPVSPARLAAPRSAPPAGGFGPGFAPGPVSGGPHDGGGRRSHWVDESGVDHRGRLVIDPDDVDYSEGAGDAGLNRRRALLALGSVVVGTAAALSPPGLDLLHKLFGGPATAPPPDRSRTTRCPATGRSGRPAGSPAPCARTRIRTRATWVRRRATRSARTPPPGAPPRPPRPRRRPPRRPSRSGVSALGTDPVRHLANRLTLRRHPQAARRDQPGRHRPVGRHPAGPGDDRGHPGRSRSWPS